MRKRADNFYVYLYSGTAATVTKTIMCRPAVNADIRFSKNCLNWYDPKSPKTCAHDIFKKYTYKKVWYTSYTVYNNIKLMSNTLKRYT